MNGDNWFIALRFIRQNSDEKNFNLPCSDIHGMLMMKTTIITAICSTARRCSVADARAIVNRREIDGWRFRC